MRRRMFGLAMAAAGELMRASHNSTGMLPVFIRCCARFGKGDCAWSVGDSGHLALQYRLINGLCKLSMQTLTQL